MMIWFYSEQQQENCLVRNAHVFLHFPEQKKREHVD